MAMFSSAERLWNESDRLGIDERNESSEASGQDEGERNYYAMLYSLLILAIVFGNVLVCLAVLRERSLQTTTNYLVVSLAVADLLVASLVMPWAVYLEVRRSQCLCLQFHHRGLTKSVCWPCLTYPRIAIMISSTHSLTLLYAPNVFILTKVNVM